MESYFIIRIVRNTPSPYLNRVRPAKVLVFILAATNVLRL